MFNGNGASLTSGVVVVTNNAALGGAGAGGDSADAAVGGNGGNGLTGDLGGDGFGGSGGQRRERRRRLRRRLYNASGGNATLHRAKKSKGLTVATFSANAASGGGGRQRRVRRRGLRRAGGKSTGPVGGPGGLWPRRVGPERRQRRPRRRGRASSTRHNPIREDHPESHRKPGRGSAGGDGGFAGIGHGGDGTDATTTGGSGGDGFGDGGGNGGNGGNGGDALGGGGFNSPSATLVIAPRLGAKKKSQQANATSTVTDNQAIAGAGGPAAPGGVAFAGAGGKPNGKPGTAFPGKPGAPG